MKVVARSRWIKFFLLAITGVLFLNACASGAETLRPSTESDAGEQANQTVVVTEVVREEGETVVETQAVEVEVTEAPAIEEPAARDETPAPTATPPVQPTAPPLGEPEPPETQVEPRRVELEWPARMRLGDSDTVRLSLIPDDEGYTLQADFPEHQIDTQSVRVPRPGGYDLWAVARLDGVNFDISPGGDQSRYLPPNEPVSWVWSLRPGSAGQQRLSITLLLHWEPINASTGLKRETTVYTRGLNVRVMSFFGLSRSQAMTGGFGGVVLGAGLCLTALISLARPGSAREPKAKIRELEPNPELIVEAAPDIKLATANRNLFQALFHDYGRVVIETEFLSGYSGARTFLAIPIRIDGRADAYTIVKIGERDAIRREYENYERFVKYSLPPMTARIQSPPVAVPSRWNEPQRPFRPAAVRYTFLAEPGRSPRSLRDTLLDDPDPAWLVKLFEVFGPTWWMQRRPYSFRMAQEYDRLLPTWYVLEPGNGSGIVLDGRNPPETLNLRIGQTVRLRGFEQVEMRRDGRSLSLKAAERPGYPRMRLRWLSTSNPNGKTGRVVATRATLLEEYTTGFDLYGLPNPFEHLEAILSKQVQGTKAIVHGDLNLENALVGPGGMLWLIDFATTREGHTLFDFAHLKAEILAHVIAPQIPHEADLKRFIEGDPAYDVMRSLLKTVDSLAGRCLFDPADSREFTQAEYLAYLGALKYANLDSRQKHLLFLQAAALSTQLG